MQKIKKPPLPRVSPKTDKSNLKSHITASGKIHYGANTPHNTISKEAVPKSHRRRNRY